MGKTVGGRNTEKIKFFRLTFFTVAILKKVSRKNYFLVTDPGN